MRFPYKHDGSAMRPIISVTLRNGSRFLRHEVLLDSGSDISFFDEEIGTFLGLDVRKGRKDAACLTASLDREDFSIILLSPSIYQKENSYLKNRHNPSNEILTL